MLNQSDGKHRVLEIAEPSGIPLYLIFDVTQKMLAAELLRGGRLLVMTDFQWGDRGRARLLQCPLVGLNCGRFR